MRRKMIISVLAAAILATAGCNTSVVTREAALPGQKSSTGKRVEANLEASNWGVFLFYYIPLWSGEPNRPNRRDYVVFGNRIENRYMERMLSKWAKQMKSDVEDVEIESSSTGFFSLWILWRRSQHATAVAVEKE